MSNIDSTLKERGGNYGNFLDQSTIAGRIKDVMINSPQWDYLDYDMKEALDMIAVKIARLLNGNPNHLDSWHDIIGYTRLVEKRLEEEQKEKDAAKSNTTAISCAPVGPTIKEAAERRGWIGYVPTGPEYWRNDNSVVDGGVHNVQEDLFPSTLTEYSGPVFRGWDGEYEYWESADGRVERYYPSGDRVMSNPTVSELFRGGGKPFNSLYDLTERDGGGEIPVATGDRNS